MTAEAHALRSFFCAHQYAVVGASTDRSKFGNKVLRWYQERQLPVTPVHPTQTRIEGEMAVRSLSDVMDGAANAYEARTSVSIVTPPHVSLGLLKYYVHDPRVIAMWLQPGAADGPVSKYCQWTLANV